MERFLQVVGESGFPLKDYMTYEILGTIMYNIEYIMCKSIYLFINCVFCVWKLHRNPGTRPGIQIPYVFLPRHIDGKSHGDHQGGIDLRSYHHVVSFSLAGP